MQKRNRGNSISVKARSNLFAGNRISGHRMAAITAACESDAIGGSIVIFLFFPSLALNRYIIEIPGNNRIKIHLKGDR